MTGPQIRIARDGDRSGFIVASLVTSQYRMGLRLVVGQVYRDSKDGEPENWRAWLWPQAGGDIAVTRSCEAVDAGTPEKLQARLHGRVGKDGPWWDAAASGPALTCEYCRSAPVAAALVIDFEYSRVKALVCEPCGKRSRPDAGKVAKAAWLFTMTPVPEEG